MISNLTSIVTAVDSTYSLQCFGSGPWIPSLHAWLQGLDRSGALAWAGTILDAEDVSFQDGGMRFDRPGSEVRQGYVRLVHRFHAPQEISRLHCWCLVVVLLEGVRSLDRLDHHSSDHSLELLQQKLATRMREDAHQGTWRIKVNPIPWSDGTQVQAHITMLQHAPGFLPDYPEARFWEDLNDAAGDVVHRRVSHDADSHGWPMVETARTRVVDYLRIAGIWGEAPTEDFRGSTGVVGRLIASYESLLAYARMRASEITSDSKPLEQHLPPFGIDWFLHVPPALPSDMDAFVFSAACEEVFGGTAPTKPTTLPAEVAGWEVQLVIDWIETGRLGLVDVRLVDLLG